MTPRFLRRACVVGAASASMCLLSPPRASGQEWTATASAGRIVHQELDQAGDSFGTSFGVAYEGAGWAYLVGGVPFDFAGPFWAGGGAGFRKVLGDEVGLGVDASAHAIGFGGRSWSGVGRATTVEVMPLVRARLGPTVVEARSGIESYTLANVEFPRTRRTHRSDARIGLAGRAVRLDAELAYVRAEEASYPFVGATAEYFLRNGRVWITGGQWFENDVSGESWGFGAEIDVARVGSLSASYSQDSWDPLYRNEPMRSWSVGLTRSLGGGERAITPALPVLPALPDAPVIGGDTVVFRVTGVDNPGPIVIAGDFTGWEPVTMELQENAWSTTLTVPSGVYRYAFRDGSGTWFVPSKVAERVDDGFGGTSAILLVP